MRHANCSLCISIAKLCLIFFVLIYCERIANAEYNIQPDAEDSIRSTILHLFKMRDMLLITGVDEGYNFPITEAMGRKFSGDEYKTTLIDLYNTIKEESAIAYIWSQSEIVDIIVTKKIGRMIYIKVREKNKMQSRLVHSPNFDAPLTVTVMDHVMIIKKTMRDYDVIYDQQHDEIFYSNLDDKKDVTYPIVPDTPDAKMQLDEYMENNPDAVEPLVLPPLEIPLHHQMDENNVKSEEILNHELEIYPYNRVSAVNYAIAYAQSYNPHYGHLLQKDCTNFASQCLYAGGWFMTTGWDKKNILEWWFETSGAGNICTYAWSAADNLAWHMYFRNRAYNVTTTCDIQLGDIVSADWNNDYIIDHQMMVTKKEGCVIYLSYHSKNTLNRSFYDIVKNAPNAWYFGWHILRSEYW